MGGGEYQFETRGRTTSSRGRITTTSRGCIKVFEIGGMRATSRRSKSCIEKEHELC